MDLISRIGLIIAISLFPVAVAADATYDIVLEDTFGFGLPEVSGQLSFAGDLSTDGVFEITLADITAFSFQVPIDGSSVEFGLDDIVGFGSYEASAGELARLDLRLEVQQGDAGCPDFGGPDNCSLELRRAFQEALFAVASGPFSTDGVNGSYQISRRIDNAAVVHYNVTYDGSVLGPTGTGSFLWDDENLAMASFVWDFGAGQTGGVPDTWLAQFAVFGTVGSGTGGQFLFELLTGQDVIPGGDSPIALNLDGPVNQNLFGAFPDGGAFFPVTINGTGTYVFEDDQDAIVAWGQYELSITSIDERPTANAGVDQAVRVGDMVFLDGSASFDDNTPSDALQYAWTFVLVPDGSGAVLTAGDTATPSFVVDVAGTYVVELAVTDETGLASPPDDVTISSDNMAPTASAGIDQLVIVDSTVFLDGTGSSDPENDTLTYSWTISSAPLGGTATLTGADTALPNFIPNLEGVYAVTLSVSDPIGPGTPDGVSITATTPEEFAEFEILEASETITGLEPGEITTLGNQTALNSFLNQATVAIQAGDLAEAINKLQKALSRTDGCALRGAPDGNGPGRDWITDCPAQAAVYDSLQSALDALSG